ncbi:GDYXXLXY domain-containing protein [Chitiniphilus purpureus]|uniref:GDYXXLXY domain-containing protein n=1 Tax=Chitiniphilus purpureus TaxID=2981137 RepID=A0ABY6DHR6_9NEIS|nr:GDYXXLXY domain-containing protein [Chitiniphilus sp. CD1]UXY13894.1 GDYXXLXY domain-containing protein [Chitiniphilus sp. CD1]
MKAWRVLLVLAGVATLAVPAAIVARHERLLDQGRPVLLELRPVDPRSLLQGDYMALDYRLTEAVDRTLGSTSLPMAQHGAVLYAFVLLDRDGVGRLQRVGNAPGGIRPGEMVLRLRWQRGRSVLPSHSYFFAEGQAARYEQARYALWRVGPGGRALLAGLADAQRRVIADKAN